MQIDGEMGSRATVTTPFSSDLCLLMDQHSPIACNHTCTLVLLTFELKLHNEKIDLVFTDLSNLELGTLFGQQSVAGLCL